MDWFRKAAGRGVSDAQSFLGLGYFMGKGAPQDYVAAYKWLYLAATQGNITAKKAMSVVARKMIPAQIAEAEQLARKWKPVN